MIAEHQTHCTAFQGSRRIASGTLAEVAKAAKDAIDREGSETVLIFDDATSENVEVDFRGTPDEVLRRLLNEAACPPASLASGPTKRETPPRPGRPKLGVVAREVTLLPRHWEWLNSQPGGASVTLRKLVEQARRDHDGKDRVRRSQEATYRFISTMAGNRPGFEEATRALFAGQQEQFVELIADWPVDIRDHAKMLATSAVTSNGKS